MNKPTLSDIRRNAANAAFVNGATPPGKQSSIQCPAAEADALRAFARRNRQTVSFTIAEAVREYLNAHA